MLSVEDIKNIIADSLYYNNLIGKELYLKCSKPKYIQSLPGDLRTTDANVLSDRLDAIEDELSRREEILRKAEYRIGVKTRDSERLSKRVEKNIANMDKAVENINGESDKIVKGITALEDKLGKIDFEDKSLGDRVDKSLKRFKDAHNKLFDQDLTGENFGEYKRLVEDYKVAGDGLHSLLQGLYDDKLINKSDLGKSDISKNIIRIEKNLDKFENGGNNISRDVQSVSDNQVDIDYITSESNNVSKEIEILLDEFESTHNKYMENSNSPRNVTVPNPQMILNIGAKGGDNFTLLPNNYEVYMLDG